ncbi:cysteine synthase A [Clostridium butyricum]|nr:cysteine synthase A [Clostridium butyricum]AXB85141.1 cysteine synthase A [Clostridium butyricum]KQB79529.1 cysteine synthase [Clostridium butyricum]MDB2136968.1 cysteine synthase A [Clostridium butyricum]MZI81524.1 cysteine synthase A [Clostridium butyricum]
MHYINDIRDIIGNTPLLKLNNITPNKDINIFAKLEYLNPGGSIKDRIGIEIIETAEKDGLLKPGSTIIEATAGNTGIGLALAAFEKGYKLIIVIPEKFSIEKQILMKALGAELIITPSDKGIEGAVEKAEKLLNEIPNSFMARQFDNPANLEANKKTGKEIYDALDGKVDVLVAGAGSGGTITGIAQYLKSKNPNIKIVLADPVGSILGGGESGTYKVEGIGNHFIPKIFDSSLIDDVEKIQDDEAMYFVRLLSKKEGVLAGSSSGAAVAGAVKQAYKAKEPINIVVILPDRSDRYFSQHLYDFNMKLSDFRFNALFDDWADEYDETVESKEGEYNEVFDNYNEILNETAKHISKYKYAKVLDIGAGTGNLTNIASKIGYNIVGVEPNIKMRKIASEKYPDIKFIPGTFLSLPIENNSIDAIISSYAFHHLTDDEKEEAVILFKNKLKKDGVIVIADTMYESEESKKNILKDAETSHCLSLLHDLETEFYSTHEVLKEIFEKEDFKVSFLQMNKYVWILTAKLNS